MKISAQPRVLEAVGHEAPFVPPEARSPNPRLVDAVQVEVDAARERRDVPLDERLEHSLVPAAALDGRGAARPRTRDRPG